MFGFHIVTPKFVIIVLAAMVVIALGLRILEGGREKHVVRIGRENITVELADTTPSREQGLSGRRSLASGTGILFIFSEPGRRGIWMKDMRFPIDIIWIAHGRVVDIAPSVPTSVPGQELPVYYPRENADMVLEVNAGFAADHHLTIGDPIQQR